MSTHFRKKNRGFTLMEFLLYISISVIVMMSVIGILKVVQEMKIKSAVISAVETQGFFVGDTITRELHRARSLDIPASPGTDSDTLSIYVQGDTVRREKIYLKDGVVYLVNNDLTLIPLTDGRVIVSAMQFRNNTPFTANGHVWYTFTVAGSSSNPGYEYTYSKEFSGGASIPVQ